MEAERAAVSLQVYEEIDKSQKNPFLEYLEPASRMNEVPDNMSKLSANDQLAVPLENATMAETPALSSGVGKVELIVPVSVDLTTSLPASTMTLSSSLAGGIPAVSTSRIWKPRHPSAHLVSIESSAPHVDPLLPEAVPRWTSPGQCVESWSSSWPIPQPSVPQEVRVETTNQQFDSGQEMVKALRQVVSSPKVEYHRFDGDPLKYVTFMHNFETYLEKDNPDESRRLQLLIQHCTGKAREAIESCANLPNDGYRVAKQTLRENFGKPHVIAEAHVKKLLSLPCLKNVDGPALLEFSRHLDTADRTLTGMGAEYVSDLNHMNTLRELAKKLPMFLRGRWTECAGKIIGLGRRPKFQDFVTFVKDRAKLVDNEFGRDMVPGSLKETSFSYRRNRVNQSGNSPGLSSFVAGTGPTNQSDNDRGLNFVDARAACLVCSKQHDIWKCSKFKGLSHEEKWRVVRSGGLCNKCLERGHISKECPKVNFKCQRLNCGGNHHTLMHRPTARIARGLSSVSSQRDNASQSGNNGTSVTTEQQLIQVSSGSCDVTGAGNSNRIAVAATGAGETRVCLGIVPVKVRGRSNNQIVETYALLDNGSEVTLCHEQLGSKLGLDRERLSFTLTGITGSVQVESHVVNLTVMSMDESIAVELQGVRTVAQMPISRSCIPREGDLARWPHLQGIDIPAVRDTEVLLLIGLKEKPSLFLPLEVKAGGVDEPIAIRYSLGWTVMGPMGECKKDEHCSVNFLQSTHDINLDGCLLDEKFPTEKIGHAGMKLETAMRSESIGSGIHREPIAKLEQQAVVNLPLSEEEQVEYDIDNETLQRQLERLWKTDFGDSVVGTKVSPSVEDKMALNKMEESLQRVGSHFQVALPWQPGSPYLTNNKPRAEQRLQLLKKRLLKDEDLLVKYRTTIQEYIVKGHAQKVPKEELNLEERPVWYLPHHPVTHPLKPEKVRVVFDCAARYCGTSLNQQLLQGPDLANRLVGVLTRFRQEQVAMAADIEAMFHQVYVDPQDRDALRFLWWPDRDLQREPEEYRMVKHLFGATSSPSCANFCLQKTASTYQEEFDPDTIQTVMRNMYVDDLMKSVSSPEAAIKLSTQLRELLMKGGFRLTKWLSNDRDVLVEIPEDERASSVINLDIEDLPTACTLGLKWNVEADKFIWDVATKFQHLVETKPMTRRGILSLVSSLFDPLGFIAPYIMKAKLLLQDLCRRKLGWDTAITEQDRIQWFRWLEDLPKLENLQVDRCFKPKNFAEIKNAQLHIFSDGSRVGYGAVAYLRLVDVFDRIHCSFVMGKARLAPIHEITIPRLELTAAVISVKLSEIIREELEIKIDRVSYWTDSTTVLKCLSNDSKRFHTFESNRLTVIRNGSSVSDWRYINRDDNPADDASKGLRLQEMVKDSRWLNGPTFLWKEEDSWPTMIEVPRLKDSDAEVRKESRIYVTTVSQDPVDSLIHHYSSVAWLLRYKQFIRSKMCKKKEDAASNAVCSTEKTALRIGNLMVIELQRAEEEIVRWVQRTSFPDVYRALANMLPGSSERQVKKVIQKQGSSIFKLNPKLRNGLLSVGGRLESAPIDEDLKHPVILSSHHHVTELLIQYHHSKVGHLGQESVLSSLRGRFWVVKGRSAVRRTLKKCLDCQRRKAPTGEQFMAKLPEDRVTPHEPPFTYVGVDYFGPIEVRQGRSRVKRWGCLFTCLTVRAIHVEVAHSLNTDSMINALRRFINLRGCPKEIRSDCGSNFTKADKELKDAVDEWNQQRISGFCTQRGIEWIFNPPGASHMGGPWERMIRSVRQILRALLKEQVVCDEVLSTVLTEATNILNSRPLTRNSDDPMDEEPLTPNHLLKLRPCASVPPGIFEKEDMYCRRQWRQAQYLANLFWKRWIKEYLPTLQERKKWNVPKENLKVDDLVLLADEHYPRGQWPLARVVEVFKGEDGYVRSAKVITSSTVVTRAKRRREREIKVTRTVLTRPITKLCRLEMSSP